MNVWLGVFVCGYMYLCVATCISVWLHVLVCGYMYLCVGGRDSEETEEASEDTEDRRPLSKPVQHGQQGRKQNSGQRRSQSGKRDKQKKRKGHPRDRDEDSLSEEG